MFILLLCSSYQEKTIHIYAVQIVFIWLKLESILISTINMYKYYKDTHITQFIMICANAWIINFLLLYGAIRVMLCSYNNILTAALLILLLNIWLVHEWTNIYADQNIWNQEICSLGGIQMVFCHTNKCKIINKCTQE